MIERPTQNESSRRLDWKEIVAITTMATIGVATAYKDTESMRKNSTNPLNFSAEKSAFDTENYPLASDPEFLQFATEIKETIGRDPGLLEASVALGYSQKGQGDDLRAFVQLLKESEKSLTHDEVTSFVKSHPLL